MVHLKNIEKLVFYPGLSSFHRSHSRSLGGLCYLAWLKAGAIILLPLWVLKVCCYLWLLLACFSLSLFLMWASLPPDFPLWFNFTIIKRTHFSIHLLAFSNPCPSLRTGSDVRFKGSQKPIFSEEQQERRGQAWIVKLLVRSLDKGSCLLYPASSWLRTHGPCPKASPRGWAIRNLYPEGTKQRGSTFLRWWASLGFQGFEKVVAWTDQSGFHDDIRSTFKLWVGIQFPAPCTPLVIFCVLWLLGNKK